MVRVGNGLAEQYPLGRDSDTSLAEAPVTRQEGATAVDRSGSHGRRQQPSFTHWLSRRWRRGSRTRSNRAVQAASQGHEVVNPVG